MIAYVLSGEAEAVNRRLRQEVSERFGTKTKNIVPHITLKAPFLAKDVLEVESVVEKVVKTSKKSSLFIRGLGNFRKDVVFLEIIPSSGMKKTYNMLYTELRKISWLEFDPKEGSNIHFHATLAIGREVRENFEEMMNYLRRKDIDMEIEFDNITILLHRDKRWETYKSYPLH